MHTATATEIKRHVGKDGTLYLADVDGTPWATNRYWAVPAAALAPLLDKFNVDATQAGTYEVNGSIRKQSDTAPNVGRMLDITEYSEPLTRLRTAAGDAYARSSDGHYLALFTHDCGGTVAVRADWLDWLSDATPTTWGQRYGKVTYSMRPQLSGPIAITADREQRHGGHLDANGHYVPETWESAGPVLLAIVMIHTLPK